MNDEHRDYFFKTVGQYFAGPNFGPVTLHRDHIEAQVFISENHALLITWHPETGEWRIYPSAATSFPYAAEIHSQSLLMGLRAAAEQIKVERNNINEAITSMDRRLHGELLEKDKGLFMSHFERANYEKSLEA
jgi:hypothetical protein